MAARALKKTIPALLALTGIGSFCYRSFRNEAPKAEVLSPNTIITTYNPPIIHTIEYRTVTLSPVTSTWQEHPLPIPTPTISKSAQRWASTPPAVAIRPWNISGFVSTLISTATLVLVVLSYLLHTSVFGGFFAALCHTFVVLSNKKTAKSSPSIPAGPDLMFLVNMKSREIAILQATLDKLNASLNEKEASLEGRQAEITSLKDSYESRVAENKKALTAMLVKTIDPMFQFSRRHDLETMIEKIKEHWTKRGEDAERALREHKAANGRQNAPLKHHDSAQISNQSRTRKQQKPSVVYVETGVQVELEHTPPPPPTNTAPLPPSPTTTPPSPPPPTTTTAPPAPLTTTAPSPPASTIPPPPPSTSAPVHPPPSRSPSPPSPSAPPRSPSSPPRSPSPPPPPPALSPPTLPAPTTDPSPPLPVQSSGRAQLSRAEIAKHIRQVKRSRSNLVLRHTNLRRSQKQAKELYHQKQDLGEDLEKSQKDLSQIRAGGEALKRELADARTAHEAALKTQDKANKELVEKARLKERELCRNDAAGLIKEAQEKLAEKDGTIGQMAEANNTLREHLENRRQEMIEGDRVYQGLVQEKERLNKALEDSRAAQKKAEDDSAGCDTQYQLSLGQVDAAAEREQYYSREAARARRVMQEMTESEYEFEANDYCMVSSLNQCNIALNEVKLRLEDYDNMPTTAELLEILNQPSINHKDIRELDDERTPELKLQISKAALRVEKLIEYVKFIPFGLISFEDSLNPHNLVMQPRGDEKPLCKVNEPPTEAGPSKQKTTGQTLASQQQWYQSTSPSHNVVTQTMQGQQPYWLGFQFDQPVGGGDKRPAPDLDDDNAANPASKHCKNQHNPEPEDDGSWAQAIIDS